MFCLPGIETVPIVTIKRFFFLFFFFGTPVTIVMVRWSDVKFFYLFGIGKLLSLIRRLCIYSSL